MNASTSRLIRLVHRTTIRAFRSAGAPVPWIAVLVAASACAGPGPVPMPDPADVRIVLDGELDDWAGIPPLAVDPTEDADTSEIGLVSLRAWDDPAWLYLALETEEPLNLQSLPGTIRLLLDADGRPATGASMEGFDGAEIVVDMSLRPPGSGREYGAGFGLRIATGAAAGAGAGSGEPVLRARNPYDVGITALPTHAADRFELRLRRDSRSAVDGLPVLDSLVRIGVVAVAPDSTGTVADALPATRYRMRTPPGPDPFEPTLAPLQSRPPGSVRMVAWNVSEGQFRTPEGHARILGAVRPDIVLLDEVYEEVDGEALAAFFAHPALARLGEWRWVISGAGGRQKTVVAARDRALRPEPTMEAVRYAPGALEGLRRQVDSSFHRALAYEERAGLSATGAWVELAPGVEGLFVPLDLQSAGYDGSPQDVLRLLQAGTIKRYVARAATARRQEAPGAGAPPVVIAGDLNLVGARAPLDLLLADRRDPYGPLAPADLPRLDEATWATWRSPRQGLFGPGRLDFTLYSRETLEQVGGFVFALDGLTDAQLADLELERELARSVSDHLLMVTDLRVR